MTRRAMLDDSEYSKRLLESLSHKCPELYSKVVAGKMHVDAAAVLAGISLPDRPRPVTANFPPRRRTSSVVEKPAPSPNGSDGYMEIARVLSQVVDAKTRQRIRDLFNSAD